MSSEVTDVTGQGHRGVAHTADARIEAWAGSREECLAEAVLGLVECFVDVRDARVRRRAERPVIAGSDDELLVAVLDEVIFGVDVDGEVPVEVAVRRSGDFAVLVSWSLAPLEAVRVVGAVPKGVSLHELRFAADDGGWACEVIVDV